MASRPSPNRPDRRVPLGDATGRVNHAGMVAAPLPSKQRSSRPEGNHPAARKGSSAVYASAGTEKENDRDVREESVASKRMSGASKESQQTLESKRTSKASTPSHYSSCDGFPNKKTHIGPWQLGKTLGKGSSARVRAARHRLTHQPVAVKIVSKKTAHMTQAPSLARLDMFDKKLPDNVDGVRRMPLAIEREVAILKLIEHPNIVKLYDIWESRDEIYLILEFVEQGDLFTYISRYGALTEEQALCVFRQMMDAVEYCHSLNICHRDLKPENILLKADGQVKIADFGMAALHQGPQYRLNTSCGSPHYAAPELLKARPYRGEKADIWSMGVILFAMMAGRLPFDEDNLNLMLAKAKRGIYEMPHFFSHDAKDLIHRILQVEPEVRITMKEMWKHPLVWKYGYLDDRGNTSAQPVDVRGGKQMTPLNLSNIDTQIFRQLRSMWHAIPEKDLIAKLVHGDPNDQKLFYWLLYNYRERQLENYNPNMTFSTSDYHLLKPNNWARKVSTRQFSQTKGKGHGRSVSRFTVISNVAETEVGTEGGTVRSYDPYKSSLVMRPGSSQASHAKIIVHRNSPDPDAEVRSLVGSQASRRGSAARRRMSSARGGAASYLQSPRSSMSSIRSSRQGTAPRVRANSRYRRGVNFSSVRMRPPTDQRRRASSMDSGRKAPASIAGDETTYDRDMVSPQSPQRDRVARQRVSVRSATHGAKPSTDGPLLWTEELVDFSNSIAKDCDEAFMSSLLTLDSIDGDGEECLDSPFSLTLRTPLQEKRTTGASTTSTRTSSHPWDSRPLPPPPPHSESMQLEILQARASRELREQRSFSGDRYATPEPLRLVENIPPQMRRDTDNQSETSRAGERRVVSAPVYAQYSKSTRPLPSIYEGSPETWQQNDSSADKPRVVSAPSKSRGLPTPHDNKGLNFLAQAENTIRVVQSPSALRSANPVTTPQPLKVRRKLARANPTQPVAPPGLDLRQQYAFGDQQPDIPEEAETQSKSSGSAAIAKKRSWFRRSSKGDNKENAGSRADQTHQPKVSHQPSVSGEPSRTESQSTGAPPPAPLPKKMSFFPFWKGAKSDPKMSLAGPEYEETPSPEATQQPSKKRSRPGKASRHEEDETTTRKIEPQQNWLARLFRVRPATQHLCLTISKRRARQEVAILLREWRKYGIRDIEVDKERNVVFARVSANNFLAMKEVSFACEIITVIEHGKRNHLSIIRFTQEKGAASSFQKVVETMEAVFSARNLLVTDRRKAKMMIKTLNS